MFLFKNIRNGIIRYERYRVPYIFFHYEPDENTGYLD